jgi:osmotically inducible protein OsmC
MAIDLGYNRSAEAVWEGSVEDGQGEVRFESGSVGTLPVSLYARFNHPKRRHQTTPEELIAAAAALDFCMAFSAALGEAGHAPTRLTVNSVCTMERLLEGGFRLVSVSLSAKCLAPGLSDEEFRRLLAKGNEICPTLMALRPAIEITVEGALVGEQ